MAYIKSAYGDQDHFTSERVLAFRKRFQRSSSQPTERVPALMTGIVKEDNSVQSTIIYDGKAGKIGHDKPPEKRRAS